MTEEGRLPTAAQIRAWLTATRWFPEPPGRLGTLWYPPHDGAPVIVPHEDGDVTAITAAVWRIAGRMGMPADEVTAEMRDTDA